MSNEVILLVEDEPEVMALVARALARDDYHLLSASSGEEALAMAEEDGRRIDLLITDIVMPGIGGRELAWRLQERFPQIGVILLSGYADVTGALQMVDSDRSIFLEKPIDLNVLRDTVRRVLSGQV
jgi:two-component system, cell cycle sensor histidine kinase and response regulator CckA